MENDSRDRRVKEMNDAIRKLFDEGVSKEYDLDDDDTVTVITRSDRNVSAPGNSSSSRVRTVDMSDPDDAPARSRTSSGSRTVSGSRTASGSRNTSSIRSASQTASQAPSEDPVISNTNLRYSDMLEEMKRRQSQAAKRSSQSRSSVKSEESRPSEGKSVSALRSSGGKSSVSGKSAAGKSSGSGKTSSRKSSVSGKSSSGKSSIFGRKSASVNKKSSAGKASSKSAGKAGGLSGFKKFLIIYSAILVVAIIVTCIILNSFLKNYEKNQPTNVAAAVVAQFETPEKLRSFLDSNAAIINQNTAILNYEDAFIEATSGKKISYVEDPGNTTNDVTTYKITADSVPVASITLVKGDKGAFGLSSWMLAAVDTSSAFSDIRTYSILVPEGSTVIVNGTELSQSQISGTGIPEVLETSSQFIQDPPTYTTYNVKVVADTIDVTGTDATGANLVFSQTENSFVAGGQASAEFIDEVSERVEDGLREYALYFIYEAFNLEDYIIDGCELYAFIFGGEFAGETYDPINPWLYNFEYIDDYEFSVFEAKNYTRYSDDCFTVDVNYKLDITFTDPDYSDENQKLDATWIWINQGGQWYLSSSKTH